MRIAVCPGSFDPITKGHLDIVHRACKLFDKVIIAVSVNAAKTGTFSFEERVELIRLCTTDLDNLEVVQMHGLLADYISEVGACAIVKGLRAMSDFEYEFQMALANKKLNPQAETVFLTTSEQYTYLSSSLVKQIASFGGDISEFVPEETLTRIEKKLYQSGGAE